MNKLKTYIQNFLLCQKYPFLKVRNVWSGKSFGYRFTELDYLPGGWRKRFGLAICEELNKLFKTSKTKNFNKKYHITQIKEKYGSLRWYDNGVPADIKEKYDEIIGKYETLSAKTCVMCGKDCKIESLGGWFIPICEECKECNK